MSIARVHVAKSSRSFRSLMCPAALHLLPIKDLKDLSAFFRRGYYRHAGPKGPEEMFSRGGSRGTGPRATMKKRLLGP